MKEEILKKYLVEDSINKDLMKVISFLETEKKKVSKQISKLRSYNFRGIDTLDKVFQNLIDDLKDRLTSI